MPTRRTFNAFAVLIALCAIVFALALVATRHHGRAIDPVVLAWEYDAAATDITWRVCIAQPQHAITCRAAAITAHPDVSPASGLSTHTLVLSADESRMVRAGARVSVQACDAATCSDEAVLDTRDAKGKA